jgi:hypothetical protein
MPISRDLADPLVEIDHLGPIHARIDPADAAAFAAFEVRGDIVPIPIGKVREVKPAIVTAALVTSRGQLRRSHAKDQDRPEPGVAIDRPGPIVEVTRWFPTPWHRGIVRPNRASVKPLRLGAVEGGGTG